MSGSARTRRRCWSSAAGAELSRREVREAAKRRQARRGAGIAAFSTALVLTVVVVAITSSPGWDDVKALFFSWDDFKESFPDVLRGFWLDVKLFVVCEILVLILGLTIAVSRGVRSPAFFPLRLFATVYTDVFRGLPVILVIYAIGFGVPALVSPGTLPSWMLDPAVLGGVALVLCYGAYVAEVYRAGIDSVHPSQRAAARSLGLTTGQTMRFVVLPQAVRRVIPPLLNDFIALTKDVALVSILGASVEAFRQAQIYAASNFNYTPLMAAALLYLSITIPLARIVDHLQTRDQRLRGAGGAV